MGTLTNYRSVLGSKWNKGPVKESPTIVCVRDTAKNDFFQSVKCIFWQFKVFLKLSVKIWNSKKVGFSQKLLTFGSSLDWPCSNVIFWVMVNTYFLASWKVPYFQTLTLNLFLNNIHHSTTNVDMFLSNAWYMFRYKDGFNIIEEIYSTIIVDGDLSQINHFIQTTPWGFSTIWYSELQSPILF